MCREIPGAGCTEPAVAYTPFLLRFQPAAALRTLEPRTDGTAALPPVTVAGRWVVPRRPGPQVPGPRTAAETAWQRPGARRGPHCAARPSRGPAVPGGAGGHQSDGA